METDIYKYVTVPGNKRSCKPVHFGSHFHTTLMGQDQIKEGELPLCQCYDNCGSTVCVFDAPGEKMDHLAVTLQSEVSSTVGKNKPITANLFQFTEQHC